MVISICIAPLVLSHVRWIRSGWPSRISSRIDLCCYLLFEFLLHWYTLDGMWSRALGVMVLSYFDVDLGGLQFAEILSSCCSSFFSTLAGPLTVAALHHWFSQIALRNSLVRSCYCQIDVPFVQHKDIGSGKKVKGDSRSRIRLSPKQILANHRYLLRRVTWAPGLHIIMEAILSCINSRDDKTRINGS